MNRYSRSYAPPITVAQIGLIESLMRKSREIAPADWPRITNDQFATALANLRRLTKGEASERIDALQAQIAEFERSGR